MSKITQKITQFPTAPNSSTDTPTEFNQKADAFVHHQSATYVQEVNQWATQANTLKDDINAIKTDVTNIAGAIPAGSINDGTTATNSVWSSSKVASYNGGIESGGNDTTGRWTKFPDGTLIQYGSVQCGTVNVPYGALFISDQVEWIFPIPFVSKPSCSGSSSHHKVGIIVGNPSTTKVFVSNTYYEATQHFENTIMAIGRWK